MNVIEIEKNVLVTMMYLLIGFVSILAVQEACMPFNKIHTFLFTTTSLGFFIAAFLFKDLLKLVQINMEQLICVIVLAIISYIIIHIKRKIYKKK